MSKFEDDYPVEMGTCEEYGMYGNCGIKCPLFRKGNCRNQEATCCMIESEIEQFQQENKQLKEDLFAANETISEFVNTSDEIERSKKEQEESIRIDYDLKDMVICALRYSLGRKTYTTSQTSQYIMENPKLIDKRVKKVMLNDLNEYLSRRDNDCCLDNDCDYQSWLKLKNWLEGIAC